MNIRRTLIETGVGRHNSVTFTGVKETTLRNTACALKDRGFCFHISRIEGGFKVWREK